MKNILTTAIILLFCNRPSAQTTYSKEIQGQITKVENSLAGRVLVDGKYLNIRERMKDANIKGISIAVVKDYKIIWAKGYGWASETEKKPVTTTTLFEPGSISKSLHAVGVLKLVQDRKLDMYTDINSYLSSWEFPYDSISKGEKNHYGKPPESYSRFVGSWIWRV